MKNLSFSFFGIIFMYLYVIPCVVLLSARARVCVVVRTCVYLYMYLCEFCLM